MKTQNVLQKQIRVSLAAPCFIAAAAPVRVCGCACARASVCLCVVLSSANTDTGREEKETGRCGTCDSGGIERKAMFARSLYFLSSSSRSSSSFLSSPSFLPPPPPLPLSLQRALGSVQRPASPSPLAGLLVSPSRCQEPANWHFPKKKSALFICLFFARVGDVERFLGADCLWGK